MQRGPKIQKTAEEKKADGTYQNYRDKPQHIVINKNPPVAPSYLSADAQAIWLEELPRVSQTGVCELDSSLFADYCSHYALIRNEFQQGKKPKVGDMTELRKLRELLGIGGVGSRARLGTMGDKEPDEFDEFFN